MNWQVSATYAALLVSLPSAGYAQTSTSTSTAQSSASTEKASVSPAGATESERSPIATDRPGNGNAATTVPMCAVQLETSLLYGHSWTSVPNQHQFSFPTLVRVGLLPILEMRVGSSIVGIDATSGVSPRAYGTDTSIGLKLQILENNGWKPNLAGMVDVFFPSGGGAFGGGSVNPEMRLAASWSLPAGFGLLLNAGLDLPQDDTGLYARSLWVANLGYTLPIFDGRLSIFGEYYGRAALADGRPLIHQIDAGAALLLSNDWQLDFYSQHGLSAAATDLQLSLGLSARF